MNFEKALSVGTLLQPTMVYYCLFVCDGNSTGCSVLTGKNETELSLGAKFSLGNGSIWKVTLNEQGLATILNDAAFGGTGLYLATDDDSALFLGETPSSWKILANNALSPTSPGAIMNGDPQVSTVDLVAVSAVSNSARWWQIIYQNDPSPSAAPSTGGLVIVGTQDIEVDPIGSNG